jgi:transposase
MTIETLKEMFRRWHANHSISSIKKELQCDRNTIRTYIRLFKAADFTPGCNLPPEQELLHKLQNMLPLRAKARCVRQCIEQHKEEVIALISRDKEPVKPKTAFLIIKEKYDLNGSYETFKLFIREHMPQIKAPDAPLRIELPPGEETQLDYGKVGFFYDPREKRNKTVWAFCAKLSCSRLPFIEYVYTQNQDSFVESAVNMGEFYGGLTQYVSIDNLKAGVIKPDLYDPLLNKAFAEYAQYYGTFINTCRVATPTDYLQNYIIFKISRTTQFCLL